MEKTQKFSEKIVLLHSHSQRFFANISLKFSNINNRRVTSAYVARDTFVFYATDWGVSVGNNFLLFLILMI